MTYQDELGPLYDLLARGFPNHRKGIRRIDVPALADTLGLKPNTLYKWFRARRLPGFQARRIAELSEGRLRVEDFAPFL